MTFTYEGLLVVEVGSLLAFLRFLLLDVAPMLLRSNPCLDYIHLGKICFNSFLCCGSSEVFIVGRVILSARGSLESLRRLRDLVTVESITNCHMSDEEKSDMMVRLVYERILQLCQ